MTFFFCTHVHCCLLRRVCFVCFVPSVAERTQGMSISIGAGYELPEEKHRARTAEEGGRGGGGGGGGGGAHDSERMAVVDDLNDKLQAGSLCFQRACVCWWRFVFRAWRARRECPASSSLTEPPCPSGVTRRARVAHNSRRLWALLRPNEVVLGQRVYAPVSGPAEEKEKKRPSGRPFVE